MFTKNTHRTIILVLAAGFLCSAPLSLLAEKKPKTSNKGVPADKIVPVKTSSEKGAKAREIEEIYGTAGQDFTGNTRTKPLATDGQTGQTQGLPNTQQRTPSLMGDRRVTSEEAERKAIEDDLEKATKEKGKEKEKYYCNAKNLQNSRKAFAETDLDKEIGIENRRLLICPQRDKFLNNDCTLVINPKDCEFDKSLAHNLCDSYNEAYVRSRIKRMKMELDRRLCCDGPKPQPGCSWLGNPQQAD